MDIDYSALSEEIETNHKSPKYQVGDRVRITKYKKKISKGYTENWSREIFVNDSLLKTNSWMDRIKDSKGEKQRYCFFAPLFLLMILV